MIVRKSPPTLEQSFNNIRRESMVRFDEEEVRSFLFEFASRVAEAEGVTKKDSDYIEFLKFIMENKLEEMSEVCFYVTSRSKNPESILLVIGDDNQMKKAVYSYLTNPINRNAFDLFDEYQATKEKAPVAT